MGIIAVTLGNWKCLVRPIVENVADFVVGSRMLREESRKVLERLVYIEHDSGMHQEGLSGAGSVAGSGSAAGRESSNHFFKTNGETPSQNATRRA